ELLDAAPVRADPRAHRATRVVSHLIAARTTERGHEERRPTRWGCPGRRWLDGAKPPGRREQQGRQSDQAPDYLCPKHGKAGWGGVWLIRQHEGPGGKWGHIGNSGSI